MVDIKTEAGSTTAMEKEKGKAEVEVMLEDRDPAPPVLSEEEERRLWRKIDWHIMPIVTVMYLCSFVDRSNIGELRVVQLAVESLTGRSWVDGWSWCCIQGTRSCRGCSRSWT